MGSARGANFGPGGFISCTGCKPWIYSFRFACCFSSFLLPRIPSGSLLCLVRPVSRAGGIYRVYKGLCFEPRILRLLRLLFSPPLSFAIPP